MTVDDLTSIQVRLCDAVRARENIIMEMLDGDAPDLLVAGFSEVHIAEHQFLNLTAQEHPRYDAAARRHWGTCRCARSTRRSTLRSAGS